MDADILARSSNPSQEMIRTYLCICNTWEVRAFPLDFDNVRDFAASLKHAGYRSASAETLENVDITSSAALHS